MDTKHRRLNKHFQSAITLVDNFSYLNYQDLDLCYNRLKIYANEYAYEVQDKIIILQCMYHPDEIIKIPYITRFSDKYCKKINGKLYRIKEVTQIFKKGLFLTLTINPNNFSNPSIMKETLSKAWNRLATLLKKKYGINLWIKTIEFTDSHIPHLHIMFFHDTWLDVNWLRGLWKKYGAGDIIRLEFIDTKYDIEDEEIKAYYPIDYIWKYIIKAYKEYNNEIEDSKAIKTKIWQWALRCRAFSVSEELVSLINRKTNSNFGLTTTYLKLLILLGRKDIIDVLRDKHYFIYITSIPMNLADEITDSNSLRRILLTFYN
jgi:hypothetical protein